MATSEFGKAFAAARKAGDKTFEFNGKKYTTKTAEDVAGEKKKATSNYSNEGRDRPVASTEKKKPEAPNIVKLAKDIRERGDADLKARGLSTSEEAKPAVTKPEPTAASYSNEGRGQSAASNKKPPPFEMPISKFFKTIRERGEDDLKSRGMKAGGSVKMAKGGSINGIAKRGLTKCKMR